MENQPQSSPANAQPDANPTAEAHRGTLGYGEFGHPTDPNASRRYTAPTNDGSNDNPDEFSAFRGRHAATTEHYCVTDAIADPALQRGHVAQNQHPEAIIAAEGGSAAEERAAYALDDPRYAGGDIFDLKDEQTGL